MKIIGLCGGSGSGKTFVSNIIAEFKIPIIDTDAIYHSITSSPGECLDAISDEFGKAVVKDGALNRKKLREIVFSSDNSDSKRKKLNEITHKFVLSEVERAITVYESCGERMCVIDVPLLFESGFDKRCDVTVAVIADLETRIRRIIDRDGIDRKSAVARIEAQIKNEDISKLVDYVIENNGDVNELRNKVRFLIQKIEEV